MTNRRAFLQKSLLTLGATVMGSSLLKADDNSHSAAAKIKINQNDVILFQGDSITDNGRNRDILDPNNTDAFGKGYAFLAGSCLLNKYAEKNIKIFNRGISGHRVPDLQKRWLKDTLDLKPSILSILIGVNDFWRTMDSNAKNTPEDYKSQYRALLDDTLKNIPNIKLIIGEPFGLKGVKHVTDAWYPQFLGYQKVAKEIADEYNAVFIPYQTIFEEAEKRANGSFWTTDGVHTSLAGSNLMAEHWLKTIK